MYIYVLDQWKAVHAAPWLVEINNLLIYSVRLSEVEEIQIGLKSTIKFIYDYVCQPKFFCEHGLTWYKESTLCTTLLDDSDQGGWDGRSLHFSGHVTIVILMFITFLELSSQSISFLVT